MTRSKQVRPAHAELARLGERVGKAREALRRAEEHERECEQHVEAMRDQVREAADLGLDAAKPISELAQAKQSAETAGLAKQGVEARVRRATVERDQFLTASAEQLIHEMEPDCAQAVEDLRAAAEALIAADRAWRALSATIAKYLTASHLVPHENAPGQHGLEGLVKDARRALAHATASPSPNWSQRNAARAERENVANLRRERGEVAA